jgi:uncharacterized membrane protein YfcA
MPSLRFAIFVRVAAQLLAILLVALLALCFLVSGRSHEPLLWTSLALASAGAGWFQARIAQEPIRRRRMRAMTGFLCLCAAVGFAARAVRLVML